MSKKEENNLYEELSSERKRLQGEGLLPDWFNTAGLQLFKDKYEYGPENRSFRGRAETIAKTAARHTNNPELWESKFFNLIWKGWLSCSTPVLANMGTDRGCPVSCTGNTISDNVASFYDKQTEVAILSKNGFGTASYLGDIRPRGTPISGGGKASGVVPVLRGFVQVSTDISQGSTRRGAWAAYLPLDHGDFWEVAHMFEAEPDNVNIGWVITDDIIEKLNTGDEDITARWKKAMKIKCVSGKGYFFFVDKVNRARPEAYVVNDLKVKTSQLCSEIALWCDDQHSFTCVLSSMNVYKYDEWKDTDAVFDSTVFLDCVAEEFIDNVRTRIRNKNPREAQIMEPAVRYTEKARSLGLGQCGFHSYVQSKMLTFGSFETHMLNTQISKYIFEEAQRASRWMATEFGEPEFCKGLGIRNTHLIAIAPTKSTAAIQGGISEGINPMIMNVFSSGLASGESERVNPVFLKFMKDKGKYSKRLEEEICTNNGSVQDQEWMTDEEKSVFKTAFEINQRDVLRLAATRQKYIDQTQSLNLHFSANESEEVIASIMKEAFLNEDIHSIYYLSSMAGVQASSGEEMVCEACM